MGDIWSPAVLEQLKTEVDFGGAMGSYYLFAFYIFALVCVVAVLCKWLFSDVKRQRKLLDEKETKLLKLYQTIEDAMDDFYEEAKESKEELKKLEGIYLFQANRQPAIQQPYIQQPPTKPKQAAAEPSPAPVKKETRRRKQAEAPLAATAAESQEIPVAAPAIYSRDFSHTIDLIAGDDIAPEEVSSPKRSEASVKAPKAVHVASRRETILALKNEGKSRVEIAKELGITQNEVDLIIGIGK